MTDPTHSFFEDSVGRDDRPDRIQQFSPVPTERSDNSGEPCKHESTWFDRSIGYLADGTEIGMTTRCSDCGADMDNPPAPLPNSGEGNRAIAERTGKAVGAIYDIGPLTAALDAKDEIIKDVSAECNRWGALYGNALRAHSKALSKITQLESDKKALIEFIQKVRIRAQTRGDEKDILLYIANICTDTLARITPERSDTNNEPKGEGKT